MKKGKLKHDNLMQIQIQNSTSISNAKQNPVILESTTKTHQFLYDKQREILGIFTMNYILHMISHVINHNIIKY